MTDMVLDEDLVEEDDLEIDTVAVLVTVLVFEAVTVLVTVAENDVETVFDKDTEFEPLNEVDIEFEAESDKGLMV